MQVEHFITDPTARYIKGVKPDLVQIVFPDAPEEGPWGAFLLEFDLSVPDCKILPLDGGFVNYVNDPAMVAVLHQLASRPGPEDAHVPLMLFEGLAFLGRELTKSRLHEMAADNPKIRQSRPTCKKGVRKNNRLNVHPLDMLKRIRSQGDSEAECVSQADIEASKDKEKRRKDKAGGRNLREGKLDLS
jgi:hypothetical protein